VLREQRSGLLEAAELILIGSLASVAAAIVVLSLLESTGIVDTTAPQRWFRDPRGTTAFTCPSARDHTAGEPDGRRELVLLAPLSAWSAEMGSVPAVPILDEFAIIPEERIALLTARYFERRPPGTASGMSSRRACTTSTSGSRV
jgi:hypothetical protein